MSNLRDTSQDRKKPITLASILNFFGAYWRKFWTSKSEQDLIKDIVSRYTENEVDPEHILDIANNPNIDETTKIVLIRTNLVMQTSPECLMPTDKGGPQCVNCSCPIPDKFYELDGCENGCYKSIRSENT